MRTYMKWKRNIIAVVLVSFSLLLGGCGQVKMGYVDTERVAQEAPQLKSVAEEATQKLAEAQQQAEAEFAAKQNPTEEDFRNAQVELQRKMASINQIYMTQLRQKLDVAVGAAQKDKKLDAVVDSTKVQKTVLLGGVDLTDEVIQKLQ